MVTAWIHPSLCLEGICGTLNSICPENTLMNNRTPKAAGYSSPGRVFGGDMRNSEQHMPGKHTDE